ncbi:MAG TPA: hypothetical protein VGR90_04780, partial [Acidimicrobiales bacterium]|nr:hypothetical protein [Acidimicrobiales bacterium]
MSPRPRMALGHAARVAAVTTAIIAALYLAIGGILDVVVVHRLTAQVDARLTQGLRDADTHPGQLPDMLEAGRSVTRDLDDAPLLFWRVNSAGGATTLTAGAPSLPVRAWSAATPLTAQLAGTQVRLDARRESYGWLVAGQSLAQANHVRTVLLVAEGVVAPLLLLAIYLGSLAIGL